MQAERIGLFLRYVVEETLSGRGDRLKEYSVAIEVFGRDVSFDPQTSSVVRVEASRLRTKLDEYNRNAGAEDAVVIELPRGGYAPSKKAAPTRWRLGASKCIPAPRMIQYEDRDELVALACSPGRRIAVRSPRQ